jgi:hypothetical protein
MQTHKLLVPHPLLGVQHVLRKWCCCALCGDAGGLLKEAVDDLEWPGGSVVVKLTRDPAAISMVAQGTGSLEVSICMPTIVEEFSAAAAACC